MILDYKDKKILILAPHTDDGEFGCGGFISKAIRLGSEVAMATFSICEESVPDGYPNDVLNKECLNSIISLGINKHYDYRFKVRKFNEKRQLILDNIIKIKKEFNPDIVLLPSTNDIHQDHKVVSEEGIRAFKNITILGYVLPWNNFIIDRRVSVSLLEDDVDNKINSILMYESQNFRGYSDVNFIKSSLKNNGIITGEKYSEFYQLINLKI